MVERLKNDELERVAQLEFECVMPIAEMELNGFYLDQPLWREQLDKVKKEQAIAADELQDMLSAGVAQASLFGRPEINLDSQQQVIGRAFESRHSGSRNDACVAAAAAGRRISGRRKAARISRRAKSRDELWREHSRIYRAQDRTHPRRLSPDRRTDRTVFVLEPNLQQIPHEDEYRRCFRAPEGEKLVIADYSQIELRILADFSGDENFIDAFVSGADFHRITAAQVFDVKPEEVTDEQRSFAKRLNFGVVYGIGASRFGMMTGLSQSDAENTMRRYFATYRKLDAYLRDSATRVTTERTARTASGRMLKLSFDENDRQAVGAARRYGVNMPIQGTSADILKLALRRLHDALRGTSARLVNIVHDEIIVECDAADTNETEAGHSRQSNV